jgi:hypothetical protein
MKITLQEKPELIPLTPEGPATFEGSLQPSQANTEGRILKTRLVTIDTSRSIEKL